MILLMLFSGFLLSAFVPAFEFIAANIKTAEKWINADGIVSQELGLQTKLLRQIDFGNSRLQELIHSCPGLLVKPPALAAAKSAALLITSAQDLAIVRIRVSEQKLRLQRFEQSGSVDSSRPATTNLCYLPHPMRITTPERNFVTRFVSRNILAGGQIRKDSAEVAWNFYYPKRLPR